MRNDARPLRGVMNDIVFIAVALIIVGWAIATFVQSMHLSLWDFQAFWGAGKALDESVDPYSPPAMLSQVGVQAAFVSPIYLAEALRPIGYLTYVNARTLWMILSLAGAVVLCGLIVSLSHARVNLRSLMVAFAVLAAFEPFAGGDMYLGQTDLFVVLAIALSWFLVEHKQRFLAGVIFCIGASNPHLILGVGLYYAYRALRRHEITLLLGMLTGGAALIAASLVYVGYLREWLTIVLPSVQQQGIWSPMMLTPLHVYFASLAMIPFTATHALQGAELLDIATMLAAIVVAVRFWERDRGHSMALDMGVATVVSVLASTFSYHQDLLSLVVLAPSVVQLAILKARWTGIEIAAQGTLWANRVAFLTVCAGSVLFSGMAGYIGYGVNENRLPFYFVSPVLCLTLIVAYLRPSAAVARRMLPWAAAFLALSAIGSFLPQVVGLQVLLGETVLIFLGLVGYLRGMWLWHPALYRFGPEAGATLATIQPISSQGTEQYPGHTHHEYRP